MKILVDSAQMKQCDKNTIEYFGVPSLVLMERAALGVVEEIEQCLRDAQTARERAGKHFTASPVEQDILLVCGFGNNGGDGLAVARMLWQKGYSVTVVMPPDAKKISEETKVQLSILEKYQIPVFHQIPDKEFILVADALFGIGLTRELTGIYREYISKMNGMDAFRVAIDIPSGIHGDSGEVMGVGFYADLTVTFAFAKLGLLLFPGAEYAGRVVVKEIGIDSHSFLAAPPRAFCLERPDLYNIPSRKVRSNKGSYGKVLTIAGKKNVAGAAFLSAKASYLTGTGLVKILTSEENRIILQQLLPEAILETYAQAAGNSGDFCSDLSDNLKDCISWPSVIVAGPGLGMGAQAAMIVQEVLQSAEVPVILDADGLNIVSEHLQWLREAKGTVVVTPHLGEMARLTGKDIQEIQHNLTRTACEFAKEYHVICVLKDARTVTALPGGEMWINTSGNNGMATAGSGDVLSGVIAGLAAQGMKPEMAAPMGVYLHGFAGDIMAAEKGTYSLMAQDILEGAARVLAGISQA